MEATYKPGGHSDEARWVALKAPTGNEVLTLRALQLSDRWEAAVSGALKPLAKAVRVAKAPTASHRPLSGLLEAKGVPVTTVVQSSQQKQLRCMVRPRKTRRSRRRRRVLPSDCAYIEAHLRRVYIINLLRNPFVGPS
ncbi:MAG: hypothetical protein RL385_39 [Pseudomonadota bacterium]